MKKVMIIISAVVATAIGIASLSFTNLNSDTDAPKEILGDNIVATISFGEGDAVIDMEDVSQVYDYADLAVIGTVTEKLDSTMSELSAFPYTPATLEIEKVLKGTCREDTITFYVSGGTVSVKQFIDGSAKLHERVEKMGLSQLSESEKESNYIKYISNHKKEYEVGERYIVLLKSCPDSNYTVISDAGFVKLEEFESLEDLNSIEDIIRISEEISEE